MTTQEVKFKNRDGAVITTSNPETINNYRLDERFEEVKPSKSSSSSSSSGSSSPTPSK